MKSVFILIILCLVSLRVYCQFSYEKKIDSVALLQYEESLMEIFKKNIKRFKHLKKEQPQRFVHLFTIIPVYPDKPFSQQVKDKDFVFVYSLDDNGNKQIATTSSYLLNSKNQLIGVFGYNQFYNVFYEGELLRMYKENKVLELLSNNTYDTIAYLDGSSSEFLIAFKDNEIVLLKVGKEKVEECPLDEVSSKRDEKE
ncbi:hypothetical protein FAZ15_21325 [Sphingobacterium olei]|uniref:Uncharacterized protein n=1 Tax=Sphingobacterium olei TaxID=2571155 RepID=A0A4U0N9N3_9SPHI|nr:hypothetical protein [Sphingobacterium olei]TJZ50565.1 hypothetical protein FAZ15_21325 [Sphingobacterium olei]